MGEEILVNLDLVVPTHGVLYRQVLEELVSIYRKKIESSLAPPVAVQFNVEFLPIDGHHRLAVRKYLGYETAMLYVPENADDVMDVSRFPPEIQGKIHDSNFLIKASFSNLPELRERAIRLGCISLEDMLGYHCLRSL